MGIPCPYQALRAPSERSGSVFIMPAIIPTCCNRCEMGWKPFCTVGFSAACWAFWPYSEEHLDRTCWVGACGLQSVNPHRDEEFSQEMRNLLCHGCQVCNGIHVHPTTSQPMPSSCIKHHCIRAIQWLGVWAVQYNLQCCWAAMSVGTQNGFHRHLIGWAGPLLALNSNKRCALRYYWN